MTQNPEEERDWITTPLNFEEAWKTETIGGWATAPKKQTEEVPLHIMTTLEIMKWIQSVHRGTGSSYSAIQKGETMAGNKQATILGHSATSVIKWMGQKDWPFEKALQVVRKLATAPIKESTIRTGLNDGKHPRWSKGTANLQFDEVLKLNQCIDPNWVAPPPEKKSEIKIDKDLDDSEEFDDLKERVSQLEARQETLLDEIKVLQDKSPRRVEIIIQKKDSTTKLKDEYIHPVFERVMFHLNVGDNVMLVGPKGSGKTTLVEQVARAYGRKYAAISLSAGVTESKLMGRVTPNITTGKSEYHSTPFVDLYESGGVFLLDEIDGGDPNVLLTLNMALANRRLVLDRAKNPIIEVHDDFLCIAAANTWGNGADRQYVGRNQMDGAFADRFTFIPMDYDKQLEFQLCPNQPDLVALMHTYRERCQKNRLERAISTRWILKAYNWMENGKDIAYVKEMMFGGWRADERQKVEAGY